MRRADRLFRIVEILRGGRLTTARALAERLEVSERTVYRDIADLIGSGVPVDGAAGLGYMMRPGYDLPPLMFSREEVMALVAGARMVRSFGGARMALAAEEALGKIEAVLPGELAEGARRVGVHAMNALPLSDAERAALDLIEAAVDARRKLSFSYEDAQGAGSARMVRPLGLAFWGKVWTLLSWCELRQDFRMFRVDRMRGIAAGEGFRTEPDKTLAAFYACQARDGAQAQPD